MMNSHFCAAIASSEGIMPITANMTDRKAAVAHLSKPPLPKGNRQQERMKQRPSRNVIDNASQIDFLVLAFSAFDSISLYGFSSSANRVGSTVALRGAAAFCPVIHGQNFEKL
jgi:hypothetical protein